MLREQQPLHVIRNVPLYLMQLFGWLMLHVHAALWSPHVQHL